MMSPSDADPSPTSCEPESDVDPETAAADRFAHGLLGALHDGDAAGRERRIRSALDRVNELDRAKRRQRTRRFVPLGATAAMAASIAVAVLMLSPTSPASASATAMVDAAIDATRSASAQRYEIRGRRRADEPDRERALGTLDMDGDRVRVTLNGPGGDVFDMGRDEAGWWSLRRDGSIERGASRSAAPRWFDLGEETLLVGSLDDLLATLQDGYDVSIAESDDPRDQLAATRDVTASEPGPERIDVWIDPATGLVDRLELSWSADRFGDRRGGEAGRATDDRPRASRPRGDRDGARRGPRPGPGPRGGPRERPRPRGMVGGRPRFGEGPHPPPPARIIFQRVAAPTFSDDHFTVPPLRAPIP